MDVYDISNIRDEEGVLRKWTMRQRMKASRHTELYKILQCEMSVLGAKFPFLEKNQLKSMALNWIGIPTIMGSIPKAPKIGYMVPAQNKKKVLTMIDLLSSKRKPIKTEKTLLNDVSEMILKSCSSFTSRKSSAKNSGNTSTVANESNASNSSTALTLNDKEEINPLPEEHICQKAKRSIFKSKNNMSRKQRSTWAPEYALSEKRRKGVENSNSDDFGLSDDSLQTMRDSMLEAVHSTVISRQNISTEDVAGSQNMIQNTPAKSSLFTMYESSSMLHKNLSNLNAKENVANQKSAVQNRVQGGSVPKEPCSDTDLTWQNLVASTIYNNSAVSMVQETSNKIINETSAAAPSLIPVNEKNINATVNIIDETPSDASSSLYHTAGLENKEIENELIGVKGIRNKKTRKVTSGRTAVSPGSQRECAEQLTASRGDHSLITSNNDKNIISNTQAVTNIIDETPSDVSSNLCHTAGLENQEIENELTGEKGSRIKKARKVSVIRTAVSLGSQHECTDTLTVSHGDHSLITSNNDKNMISINEHSTQAVTNIIDETPSDVSSSLCHTAGLENQEIENELTGEKGSRIKKARKVSVIRTAVSLGTQHECTDTLTASRGDHSLITSNNDKNIISNTQAVTNIIDETPSDVSSGLCHTAGLENQEIENELTGEKGSRIKKARKVSVIRTAVSLGTQHECAEPLTVSRGDHSSITSNNDKNMISNTQAVTNIIDETPSDVSSSLCHTAGLENQEIENELTGEKGSRIKKARKVSVIGTAVSLGSQQECTEPLTASRGDHSSITSNSNKNIKSINEQNTQAVTNIIDETPSDVSSSLCHTAGLENQEIENELTGEKGSRIKKARKVSVIGTAVSLGSQHECTDTLTASRGDHSLITSNNDKNIISNTQAVTNIIDETPSDVSSSLCHTAGLENQEIENELTGEKGSRIKKARKVSVIRTAVSLGSQHECTDALTVSRGDHSLITSNNDKNMISNTQAVTNIIDETPSDVSSSLYNTAGLENQEMENELMQIDQRKIKKTKWVRFGSLTASPGERHKCTDPLTMSGKADSSLTSNNEQNTQALVNTLDETLSDTSSNLTHTGLENHYKSSIADQKKTMENNKTAATEIENELTRVKQRKRVSFGSTTTPLVKQYECTDPLTTSGEADSSLTSNNDKKIIKPVATNTDETPSDGSCSLSHKGLEHQNKATTPDQNKTAATEMENDSMGLKHSKIKKKRKFHYEKMIISLGDRNKCTDSLTSSDEVDSSPSSDNDTVLEQNNKTAVKEIENDLMRIKQRKRVSFGSTTTPLKNQHKCTDPFTTSGEADSSLTSNNDKKIIKPVATNTDETPSDGSCSLSHTGLEHQKKATTPDQIKTAATEMENDLMGLKHNKIKKKRKFHYEKMIISLGDRNKCTDSLTSSDEVDSSPSSDDTVLEQNNKTVAIEMENDLMRVKQRKGVSFGSTTTPLKNQHKCTDPLTSGEADSSPSSDNDTVLEQNNKTAAKEMENDLMTVKERKIKKIRKVSIGTISVPLENQCTSTDSSTRSSDVTDSPSSPNSDDNTTPPRKLKSRKPHLASRSELLPIEIRPSVLTPDTSEFNTQYSPSEKSHDSPAPSSKELGDHSPIQYLSLDTYYSDEESEGNESPNDAVSEETEQEKSEEEERLVSMLASVDFSTTDPDFRTNMSAEGSEDDLFSDEEDPFTEN